MKSRHSKAALRAIAFLGAGALTLTACSETTAPGTPDSDGGGDDSSTLRISSAEWPETRAAVDAFQAAHPDINVELELGTPTFEDGSVQTLLRSGQAPDVILLNSGPGRVGLLADANLIMSLEEVFASKNLEERFRPDVLEQMKNSNSAGEYFEVVQGLGAFEMYYNTRIFDEADVEPPETFDDLLELCEPLSAGGVAPITLGVRDFYSGGWLMGMLMQASAGEEAMRDVLFGDAPINTGDFVRAGEMLRELVEGGCIDAEEAAAVDNEQAAAAFFGGKAPMTPAYQGVMVEKEATGADLSEYSSFPVPSVRDGAPNLPTSGFDHSWVVGANTRAKSAVYEWLDFVSSSEYAELATEHGALFVPAIITEDVELNPWVAHAAESIEEGAGYNPSVYLDAGSKDAYYQAVQGILSGSTSPQDAMDSVQAALEQDRS